jgi:hypothetical protein
VPINSVESSLIYSVSVSTELLLSAALFALAFVSCVCSCMVRIKFTARPRSPVVSASHSPMASKGVADVSTEHREFLMEQLDTSLTNEQPVALMEVTSEPDVGSDESNVFDDTDKSGNVSDNGGHVKIGVEAALAGMCFDFGRLKVTKGRISDLKNSSHFFSKRVCPTTWHRDCSNPQGEQGGCD